MLNLRIKHDLSAGYILFLVMKRLEKNYQLMDMHNTAVYVGAGIDVLPILLFRNITKFIYIDSQPLTEFGASKFCESYARPQFPINFHNTIRNIGFTRLPKRAPNLVEYVHMTRGTEVLYFMNNRFPNHIDDLAALNIKEASVLICCGYNPNKCIIEMMKAGPKVFIGDNKTCYLTNTDEGEDEHDKNGVCKYIDANSHLFESFWRFDIPKNYPYYTSGYVEEHHIVKFRVSQYNTLKNLYQTRKA